MGEQAEAGRKDAANWREHKEYAERDTGKPVKPQMDTTVHASIVIVQSSRFQLIEQPNSVRLLLEHFRLPVPPLAQGSEVIHEIMIGQPALLIAGQNGHRLFVSCFKVFRLGDETTEFQRLRAAYDEFSERERKRVR